MRQAHLSVDFSADLPSFRRLQCSAPWVALLTLNPLSLFFICFWGVAGIFASFAPKLVHFVLLELAIVQVRMHMV